MDSSIPRYSVTSEDRSWLDNDHLYDVQLFHCCYCGEVGVENGERCTNCEQLAHEYCSEQVEIAGRVVWMCIGCKDDGAVEDIEANIVQEASE